MTHESAVSRDAAEQYVLGEMSATERDDFEAHFFDCSECAEQVRSTAVFADNALAVLTSTAERASVHNARETSSGPASWIEVFRRFTVPAFAICGILFVLNAIQFSRYSAVQSELASATSPQ